MHLKQKQLLNVNFQKCVKDSTIHMHGFGVKGYF